jgi:hypothetical protein
MACSFVTEEMLQDPAYSGDLAPTDYRTSSAESKFSRPQIWRLSPGGNSCDTMPDNAGHGLLWKGDEVRPTIR